MSFWIALSTIGLLFSLAVTWWVHSQYALEIKVLPAAPPPKEEAPWISVIVPARNEERNIAACVSALLRQTYPNYELIVVDDRSSDATPAVLSEIMHSDARLRVINGSELPPGWAGKPHALHQGAQAARLVDGGDSWLCFIDADTFAEPGLLSGALAKAQETGADLFTMLTRQRLVTFWEKVILPVVFTALSVGFSPRKVNDPRRPDAIANGQFLLFRRAAYEQIDGHRGVAGSIVEDRDLARRIKAAGLRLVVADGQALAATRMYTSFREIWEGWTKNIYLGLSDQRRLALLGVFGALLSLLGAVGFIAWIGAAAVWLARGGGLPALIVLGEALAAFGVLLVVRAQAARGMGISPLYGLTLPMGALLFGAMMAASTFQVLSRRGVTWKGRRYQGKPL